MDQPGQKQGFKHRTVPGGTLWPRVVTMAPQWDGSQEAVITVVSPEDTLEEELTGKFRREVRWEATDVGLLEAEVTEAHLASAEGHPWVVVREVEGMVQASVVVAEGDSAEVPDFS